MVSSLFWYTGRDSNPQPSEPESDALSIEPPVHLFSKPQYYSKFFPVCKGEKEKIMAVPLHFGKKVVFPGLLCYNR